MKICLSIILISLSMTNCTKSNSLQKTFNTAHCIDVKSAIDNSINLNDKIICIKGEFKIQFEGNSVKGFNKSIWVDWTPLDKPLSSLLECDENYGFVEGLYKKDRKGHMGQHSGSLIFLTKIKCKQTTFINSDNSYLEEKYNYNSK